MDNSQTLHYTDSRSSSSSGDYKNDDINDLQQSPLEIRGSQRMSFRTRLISRASQSERDSSYNSSTTISLNHSLSTISNKSQFELLPSDNKLTYGIKPTDENTTKIEQEKTNSLNTAELQPINLHKLESSGTKFRYEEKQTDMDEKFKSVTLKVVKDALEVQQMTTDMSIAQYIKETMDAKYKPSWHCICGTSYGSYTTHTKKSFLYFDVYEDDVKLKSILLFKT